jgi:hypothetical protein
MNIWPVQATKDGAEAAVLASVNEWRRLQRSARPTLKSLLLSEGPRWDFPVPQTPPARSPHAAASRLNGGVSLRDALVISELWARFAIQIE